MILPVIPDTVGWGHGSAALVAFVLPAPPMPAPPDVPVAEGVPVHCPGPCVGPLKLGSVMAPALVGVVALAPPAEVAPPRVLALAVGAPASANAARDGSMRWATRKTLFRGPAGLADGLALKEPAPPAGSPRDSPQGTGSPAPRMSRPADSASRQYTCCSSTRRLRRLPRRCSVPETCVDRVLRNVRRLRFAATCADRPPASLTSAPDAMDCVDRRARRLRVDRRLRRGGGPA